MNTRLRFEFGASGRQLASSARKWAWGAACPAGPFTVLAALALATTVAGCGPEEEPYKPRPAVSGKKASLPAVPTLPQKVKKQGDAYTVWGVTHDLRSRVHNEEVNGKKISIVGYIVKTNLKDAPACAVHKTGKADPPECKAPVPSFSIADEKNETKDMIDVMGWASNFAQIYTMIEAIDKAVGGKENEVKLQDEFWGMDLPNPIPNIGAKVKVTGTYGVTFTKATGGAAANPKYGIMTAERIEFLEAPPAKAYLPGMKEKPGTPTIGAPTGGGEAPKDAPTAAPGAPPPGGMPGAPPKK